ncbi:hypothetical protein GA0115240_109420 [Streptomyces sp. DvalAA-14]|uniref:CU044_2847 family protein n=1 Tax=unclassified Streptomyces TaxID=2593676 RepID=UPI00081AEB83|nr:MULTISPECIES: CU044_2847 family protein [unclassified Streptomyces]MYS19511.1 hypothetical protein [Streptomyces sp. SID4948]SCD46120.1 hypothetical protein GA0115240_109420 [Streptomyces sp. DvalAA-14]
MSDAVAFSLTDGTVVLVTPPARAGTGAVGLGDRLETAQRTLREALAPVTAAASEAMDGFRELAHRPDEVEISFGVVLDGKLGGVIASANASAHLDVTLRWHAPDAEGRPAEPGALG